MKPLTSRALALCAGLLAHGLVPGPNGAAALAAPSCPRVPTGLRCREVPADQMAQRRALQALDVEGRNAVGRGDYVAAGWAFGCLVERDPTPESAGNLALVLREQGALGDALLIARCAERLAPAPGPGHDRARARRIDIENRLGLAGSPGQETDAGPFLTPSMPLDAGRPAWSQRSRMRRGFTYAALAVGVTALISSGILFALARDRAQQFDAEQTVNGYTPRARDLRDDTRTFETSSWAGGGVAVASLLAAGAALKF